MGGEGITVQFLLDERPLDFAVVRKFVLVQPASPQSSKGGGVVLKKYSHIGGMGRCIAGSGYFAHGHTALQGQYHQRTSTVSVLRKYTRVRYKVSGQA